MTNDHIFSSATRFYLLAANACLAIMLGLTVAPTAHADAIYRVRGGRLTGTVQSVSPVAVSVKTDHGDQTIDAWNVTSIAIEGQPLELRKARKRFDDQRFDECLEELEKIDVDSSRAAWQSEYDFLRAAANAELALAGGTVTAQEAGKGVNSFLRKHSDSYLKFPATELFGRLLFAFGKLDAASVAFSELLNSGWPTYQAEAAYLLGQTQLAKEDFSAAADSFERVIQNASSGERAEHWTLMAQCQRARCAGMTGDAKAAVGKLKKMVAQHSADNADLFAIAFNSLGDIYRKQGQLAEARIEYLKTQLLYANATDAHAEALYWLTQVCGQLNETDRANRARQSLKSRYPNSWWASRL